MSQNKKPRAQRARNSTTPCGKCNISGVWGCGNHLQTLILHTQAFMDLFRSDSSVENSPIPISIHIYIPYPHTHTYIDENIVEGSLTTRLLLRSYTSSNSCRAGCNCVTLTPSNWLYSALTRVQRRRVCAVRVSFRARRHCGRRSCGLASGEHHQPRRNPQISNLAQFMRRQYCNLSRHLLPSQGNHNLRINFERIYYDLI